jgi:hypothetical protein
MNSVRLKRLQSDYEAVRRLVHLHPQVEIDGVLGAPPELYRLFLGVRSLRQSGSELTVAERHRLEIRLPQGYPRDAPVCRMLTPVFHPNIAPHVVCVGDHWTAGESLDALIMRVCEMLASQSYNTKSPLNGEAAQWVDGHRDQLPTDRREFVLDLEAADRGPAVRSAACANCGAAALEPCAEGHPLCPDCLMRCEQCGKIICLACGHTTCLRCQPVAAVE